MLRPSSGGWSMPATGREARCPAGSGRAESGREDRRVGR
jgi:hypothetical protein